MKVRRSVAMTIKKRLVVSNILMILVPVFITIAIAAASVGTFGLHRLRSGYFEIVRLL